MAVSSGNILSDVPKKLLDEQFQELLSTPNVRIERIVSTGQSTPPGQWLDQDRAEWVMVVQGAAQVRFEVEAQPQLLGPGDYLHIPPHARHRVEWTDPKQSTVWLAVHYR